MGWVILILALVVFGSKVKSIKLGFWFVAIEFWKPTARKELSDTADDDRHLE